MKSVLLFAFLLIALVATVVAMPADVRKGVFTRRNLAIAAAVVAAVALLFSIAVLQTGVSFQLF